MSFSGPHHQSKPSLILVLVQPSLGLVVQPLITPTFQSTSTEPQHQLDVVILAAVDLVVITTSHRQSAFTSKSQQSRSSNGEGKHEDQIKLTSWHPHTYSPPSSSPPTSAHPRQKGPRRHCSQSSTRHSHPCSCPRSACSCWSTSIGRFWLLRDCCRSLGSERSSCRRRGRVCRVRSRSQCC